MSNVHTSEVLTTLYRCINSVQTLPTLHSIPRSRIPRRILDQLSRMSIQTHDTLQDQIRHIKHRKPDHRSPRSELRPNALSEVQRCYQRSNSREQEPFCHGILKEDKVHKPVATVRKVGDDETDKQASVLRDEIETHLTGNQEGEKSRALHGTAFACGWIGPDQWKMTDGCLGPAYFEVSRCYEDEVLLAMEELTLRPSHPLLPERSKRVRSHLVRYDIHIVYSVLAAAISPQCRVDVLSKHAAVHLQVADDISTPPAVAAAEKSELEHAAATRMSDGIDLVEFDGDQASEERFVCVVHDATPLHDVHFFFLLEETFGRPADIVRMRAVVSVEDAGVVCRLGSDGEEVVEVIGLRGRVGHFDDCELIVFGCQLVQVRFDWLN